MGTQEQRERVLEECTVSTIKYGGGKVMVWGTMARSGVGSLTVVGGQLNSEACIKVPLPKADLPGDFLQNFAADCRNSRTVHAGEITYIETDASKLVGGSRMAHHATHQRLHWNIVCCHVLPRAQSKSHRAFV